MRNKTSSPGVKVQVQRTRKFSAYFILMNTANMALESADKKEPGWLHHELIAITFSALALEALANTLGNEFIPQWKHFENATPVAKLLVIAQKLEVACSVDEEPWRTANWLIRFRNKIVHAKPEHVVFKAVMSKGEFNRKKLEYPASKMELEITLNNAKRAVNGVEQILFEFSKSVLAEDFSSFLSDGWSGTISTLRDGA